MFSEGPGAASFCALQLQYKASVAHPTATCISVQAHNGTASATRSYRPPSLSESPAAILSDGEDVRAGEHGFISCKMKSAAI